MANLPDYVKAYAEHVPAEDLAIAILRAKLTTGIDVITQIALGQQFPAVMVRRLPSFFEFNQDERFFASDDLAIHCFAEDPDGDRDAAILAEACRVIIRDAWLEDHFYDPDLGSVSWMEVLSPPRRTPDWATATGPVQYADLPSNVWRYELRLRLIVRKPPTPPYV